MILDDPAPRQNKGIHGAKSLEQDFGVCQVPSAEHRRAPAPCILDREKLLSSLHTKGKARLREIH